MRGLLSNLLGVARWVWAVHNGTLEWGEDVFWAWWEQQCVEWDQRKDER